MHCIIGLIVCTDEYPWSCNFYNVETLTPNDYSGLTHTRVILSNKNVSDIRRDTSIELKLREVSTQCEHVSPISRYDNIRNESKRKIFVRFSPVGFAAKLYVWHRPHYGQKAPPLDLDSTVIRVGRITTPLQPASVNYRTK